MEKRCGEKPFPVQETTYRIIIGKTDCRFRELIDFDTIEELIEGLADYPELPVINGVHPLFERYIKKYFERYGNTEPFRKLQKDGDLRKLKEVGVRLNDEESSIIE